MIFLKTAIIHDVFEDLDSLRNMHLVRFENILGLQP